MSNVDPPPNPLSDAQERVLQDLLCGDLDPGSPEAQELFAAHPHLRNDMLALESTQNALSKLTKDAPDVVEEARQGITERDRDLVRGSIPRANAGASGRWKLLVGGLAAAAAALVLAGPALWTNEDPEGNGPVTGVLSGGPVHPVGEIQGTYGPFEVDVELEPGQKLRFRIFNLAGTEVASSKEETTVWEPEAEVAEAIEQLPSIVWMYSVVDGSVSTGLKGRAEATKAD